MVYLVILFYIGGGLAMYTYIVTNDFNGSSGALENLIKGNQKTGI